ncbi:MAG: hypothetical protein HPM95_07650 [Alphaproteobacteria bacterium]|nr:hypothetical protein [Alphaproteobacteria bacterium]
MVMLVVFVIVHAFVAMVIGDMTMQNRADGRAVSLFRCRRLVWAIPAGQSRGDGQTERMQARARAEAEALYAQERRGMTPPRILRRVLDRERRAVEVAVRRSHRPENSR